MSKVRHVRSKIEEPTSPIKEVIANTEDSIQVSIETLKTIVQSAPALPPLPADPIGYVEKVFRPAYKEFLEKLRKYAE